MSSPRYTLGINTCFAVKRWPEPERWAEIVAGTLGNDAGAIGAAALARQDVRQRAANRAGSGRGSPMTSHE